MEQVIQIKMSVDELKSLVTDAVRETFSQKEENDELESTHTSIVIQDICAKSSSRPIL